FVLASSSAALPGLGLGAVGLAVKLLVLQVIGVNLQSTTIARAHGWRSDSAFQAICAVLLLTIAFATRASAAAMVPVAAGAGARILAGASLYILLTAVIL